MTRNRFIQIGLDRLVRLDWLEKLSSLVLAGNDSKIIKSLLQNEFLSSFRSEKIDVRGSLDKSITILLKVWLKVPSELEVLRLRGLELLKIFPQQDHLPVHWGMVSAVYPFWSGVATQVGRLLRLQSSAAAPHIQRRIREQYGERETVSRRTRYVLRSYLDWGVLHESDTKGVYTLGTIRAIDDIRLIAWLAETSLHTRANGSAPFKQLMNSPGFFPYRIKQVHSENLVAASSGLEILRHGVDDELLMLKKV